MSIKTLSPYYVYVPLINPLTLVVCESYTLKLYVWEGSKVAAPSTPSYEITKINASNSNGNDKIDIARIVNDFIEFECSQEITTLIVNSDNQVWVKYAIFYNDLPDVPSIQEVELGIKGKGYFLEGENPQLPVNRILISGDEFKVNRNGFFVMPLLASEPTVTPRELIIMFFTLDAGTVYNYSLSSNFTYNDAYFFVRPVGTTEFTPLLGISNQVIVPDDIADSDFEVKAVAFDNVTSQNVESDLITITV